MTADSPALRDAERRLEAAVKLPLDQQPLDELLGVYQELQRDSNLSAVDRRIIAVRLGQLRRNSELAEGFRALRQAAQAGSAPIEPPAPPRQLSPGTYDPSRYDAVGTLLASTVYNGETGPRLFRLTESATGRTIAYLTASSRFDPAQGLGRVVGIMGETRYDPALKLNVIDVESIDVLLPQGRGRYDRRDEPARPQRVEPMGEMELVPAPRAEPQPEPQPEPAAEEPAERMEEMTEVTPATQPADEPNK